MMKKEMLQLDSWEITLEIARLRRRIAVLQRWRLLAWQQENSEILPRPDMTTPSGTKEPSPYAWVPNMTASGVNP